MFPVGRLDCDTEGLLLLTNDGALTHRLTHPSFGVDKEYLAEVEGAPSRAALRRLREGVELDDGVDGAGEASLRRRRACSASPSTRAATARSAACARPSATPSSAWSAPASARITDRTLKPGEWRDAHARTRCGRSRRRPSARSPGSTSASADVLHLRLIVPPDLADAVVDGLRDRAGVAHLVRTRTVAERPEGEVVLCDVAREAADEVIEWLQDHDVHRRGAIAVEAPQFVVSDAAAAAGGRAG